MPEENIQKCPGFTLPDGTIGELVVNPSTQEKQFIVINPSGDIQRVSHFDSPDGVTFVIPGGTMYGHNIQFAADVEDYGDTLELYNSIKAHIHRYVEVPETFENIASVYVMLTWDFDALPSLPYLRARGDYGTGKSRLLKVVGSLCFRYIAANGAISSSALFRILDKCPGTLTIDEADFSYSENWSDIIRILNVGYEPGNPVIKSEGGLGIWVARTWDVFGPKIIASRQPFGDPALESRCLGCITRGTTREDIPLILPRSFDEEVIHLRNRLLSFRFKNLNRVRNATANERPLSNCISQRLNQILMSMSIIVAHEPSLIEVIREYANQRNEELLSDQRSTPEAIILAAILEMHRHGNTLTMKDIAYEVLRRLGYETSPKRVGHIVRHILNLPTQLDGNTNRSTVIWNPQIIRPLARNYGLEFPE